MFREHTTEWDILNNATDKWDSIWQMLVEYNLIDDYTSNDFNNLFKKYSPHIKTILKVLQQYFAKELGNAEFDVESYNIDVNGNHRQFYTGFDRYELKYVENTNRIDYVIRTSNTKTKPSGKYKIEYDHRGNQIQTLHKGIRTIKYYNATNRPKEIILTNEKRITYGYDGNGNRIFKCIKNSNGEIEKEIIYIRDEKGRCLVERQITYLEKNVASDVMTTAYVYGPRGLVGFFRRDQYYNILTDHEGSVRLVVKNGEVVAAYDYLPYGGLMRVFGNDPESHISIRYTGHEWDEEVGLYYMLARFYDPEIGRFLQIDPLHQYFSPYKYAGNSPVSLIDPTGEFAFILAIAFAVVGAYLGASAANGSYNPLKWDFTNVGTYLGFLIGGLTGALLPGGFGASVTFLGGFIGTIPATLIVTGVGAAGFYINAAGAAGSWDPSKWDWSNPSVLYDGFSGFAIGSSFFGGIGQFKQAFQAASRTGKIILGTAAVVSSSLYVVEAGIATNWDFSNPKSIASLFNAVGLFYEAPLFLVATKNFLSKRFKNIGRQFKLRKKISNVLKIDPSYPGARSHYKSLNKKFYKEIGKLSAGIALPTVLGILSLHENDYNFDSASTYVGFSRAVMTGGVLATTRCCSNVKRLWKNDVQTIRNTWKKMKHVKMVFSATKAIKTGIRDLPKQLIKTYIDANKNVRNIPTFPRRDVNLLELQGIGGTISPSQSCVGCIQSPSPVDPTDKSPKRSRTIRSTNDLRFMYPLISSVILIYNNEVEINKNSEDNETNPAIYFKNHIWNTNTEENKFKEIGDTEDKNYSTNDEKEESNSFWITSEMKRCFHRFTMSIKNITNYVSGENINAKSQYNSSMYITHNTSETSSVNFTPDYSVGDFNSSVLLIDLCLRKITGEKYVPYSEQDSNSRFITSQKQAIMIVNYFEDFIKEKLDLDLDELIDLPELQCNILNTLVKGNSKNLPEMLHSALTEGLRTLKINLDNTEKIIHDFISDCKAK